MNTVEKNKTPMMQQYEEIRQQLTDNTLLLFRLGDFYEMFYEDAQIGAKILGLTLTSRNGIPMAGLPFHAADNYVTKLLNAGKKVAFCEQLEAPQAGKLVKRSLTRILTPGTILEDNHLESNKNHSMVALEITPEKMQLAWLDLSNGDFQIAADHSLVDILPILYALDPKEILVSEKFFEKLDQYTHNSLIDNLKNILSSKITTQLPSFAFDAITGTKNITQALKILTLESFGVSNYNPALGCAGALLHYATQNLRMPPQNLHSIREYKPESTVLIDPASLKNLEIFKSTNNTRCGSLLDAMDATLTAPGARLLEQYLMIPTIEIEEIHRRQLSVRAFLEAPSLSAQLQSHLKNIRDIQRIVGRLQNRIRNPRELGGIRDTLNALPPIIDLLEQWQQTPIKQLSSHIGRFEALNILLNQALQDTLPSELNEGGFIKDQYNSELDELRLMSRNHKQWLAELEQKEQEKSGIKNLKVKYNGAFGYFIEITKANLHLVPSYYIRRQTMTNGERFCTDELKQKEREILGAEERGIALEQELFKGLVQKILDHAPALLQTAHALAQLDVFLGWAGLARMWDYCCPIVDTSDTIHIEEGRHPVVEQMLKKDNLNRLSNQRFVPNDTFLSSSHEQIALITGPNMAGKSTYIRQVALIVLMAYAGSWVPAKNCRIGRVDRIFSRVGASDELAKGHSTFMVEMNETANILNNATASSLIILDEIGRGTSTYDGLSIAWATAEYLHSEKPQGPKTLFATHYHELTQLENYLPRFRNYSVAVKEWNDEIIFVRQVIRGAADRSYGIHVARLAGLPKPVITRAESILKQLEATSTLLEAGQPHTQTSLAGPILQKPKAQLELF